MKIVEIRRYPVKSLLGEVLPAAAVGARGLDGDRLWAVRDADGKLGSGKSTRRFRRMPGLFAMRATAAAGAPVVELPDGRRFAADDPAGHRAVSAVLGRDVTLAPEADVPHHDEGPVSIVTTAALRHLTGLGGGEPGGGPLDPGRFRANLLLDVPGTGFPEDGWHGRLLRAGPQVVLRVIRPLTRCVMVDMAQDGACDRDDLLKLLAARHGMTFGVLAAVQRPGRVTVGDGCALD
ncbi:MOSC domain-containing protein [Dactylosporangium aurantiacum]|uniref:MOSC domain-containing protein n=1 Tax=Dactylosporangium aurantiacum TaxID=35754 RepID=A0A9Q9IN29_9ACTN|nr:MOSC N-terminal beta barrel domain-containing protein [Dactylosporangium aurantiacum]MDG6107948.1 MOSC domain-containing protein [Dactylosporangium aurantiacum]UWZ59192.1 MOSC domain-containing protein [Dactylosporangium aurantiacum]